MKYEIINPSDKAYIEGNDFKNVCLATIVLGEGFYGLKEVVGSGNNDMPPTNFCPGWFIDKFKQTIEEVLKSSDRKALKEILMTVKLSGERSSLNDIVGRAQYLVKILEN